MQWLNNVVDEIIKAHPDGELVVSSGVTPSGKYHLGTLREVLTAEAISFAINKRGRKAKHIHVVDDFDVFRKVPADVPEDYSKYLGLPVCDIPAPDGSDQTYASYYLEDLKKAAKALHLDMEMLISHEKYRAGFFQEAIEITYDNNQIIKTILESVSGHKLGSDWFPMQVIEDGYLKSREITSLNKDKKTLTFKDSKGKERTVSYEKGEAKLNWRIDWPARWWLLGVKAEPFGRDHATKGGSYDTGAEIAKQVFKIAPPFPVPYAFVNRSGETKKMSKSAGNVIEITSLLEVLPAEVIWFFIIRYAPSKQLFFDESETLIRLMDEFGALLAKQDKTSDEELLLEICLRGVNHLTISRVPFSHLAASYQASLRNVDQTLAIIARSEYGEIVREDKAIIIEELKYIDRWLDRWAPENIKFKLLDKLEITEFSDDEKLFFKKLADKVKLAPAGAEGDYFHNAIYEVIGGEQTDAVGLFKALYKLLIGKESGPRAGFFLSILPRDWLLKRLNLEA